MRSTDLVMHQANVNTNSASKNKRRRLVCTKSPERLLLEGPLHNQALYKDTLSPDFKARKAQRQFSKRLRETDQSLNISKAKWVTSTKKKIGK